jgi:hypothetical protein
MGGGPHAWKDVVTDITLQAVAAFFGVPSSGAPVMVPNHGRGSLPSLFDTLGYRVGAEVGVWEGAFSERICHGMPGVELTCVDPWEPYSEYRERKNDRQRLDAAYQSTVARLKPFGCHVWRMTSLDAAECVPDRSLDFLYLDANHARAFVSQDLEAWMPKIRSGGILAGHDYVSNAKKPWIEVKPAVEAFTSKRGIWPWFVLAADKSPSFLWIVA